MEQVTTEGREERGGLDLQGQGGPNLRRGKPHREYTHDCA